MVSPFVPTLVDKIVEREYLFLGPASGFFVSCLLYIFRVDFENLCNALFSMLHSYWPLILTL